MTLERPKITLKHGIGYGLTDIMGGGYGVLINMYWAYFLSTFAGLTLLQATSILGITRLLDSIIAILVGNLTDNFYKSKLGRKYGRRRFFLLIGSPLMLIYGLMWVNGLNYWFYLVTYIVFDALVSLVLIPYETLPSEMTEDYKERTILSSCRMFISGLTGTIMSISSSLLIKNLGDDNPLTYSILGFSFAIIFMIAIFITYKTTWERPLSAKALKEIEERQNKQKINPLVAFKNAIVGYFSTLKVRAFRQHLGIYLMGLTGQDIFSTLFTFFCVFSLQQSAAFPGALLAVGLIGPATTPIQAWLFLKLGPKGMYSIAFLGVISSLFGFWLLYMSNIYLNNGVAFVILAYCIATVFVLTKGLLYFVPWNVFPFIPDVDEIITAERREGRFAAFMTFTRKATGGIAAIVIGALLTGFGFESGATIQSPMVRTAIANMLFFGVGGISIIGWLIALGFNLNRKNHTVLINEINRLKAGGSKTDVTPETKKVVENLTGINYNKLWPILPPNWL